MRFSDIKHIGIKIIVFALALQVLNLSVHGGDWSHMPVNRTHFSIGAVNQVDCLVEFIYEDICHLKGYDDAYDMALHNKVPGGHKLSPKFMDFQMPAQPNFAVVKATFNQTGENHFPKWENKYEYLFSQEITPPPPKNV